MKPIKPLTLETLESRLAPANFFVSGTALTVKDAAGNDAQNLASETAAQSVTGATKAILLNAGDSLVFDPNDNHVRDLQERVLMTVAAGRAMVFLSDGFGATAGAFDENEISGLAVSNGFKGAIHTDVNGGVTTTLDAAGNFQTTALQNTSVAGLTIDGRVLDDFIAGKNISNVRVGSGLFTAGPEQSVQNLFTGVAGDTANVKYSFSGPTFSLSFSQPAGANGGNIYNVRLENGATFIGAGDGGRVTSGIGNGGAGGNIVRLTVIDSPKPISISAGTGGFTVKGNGGAGGSIFKSWVAFRGDAVTDATIFGGFGGDSDAGNGGKGGAISRTTIHMLGDGGNLGVLAGVGGQASGAGSVAGSGGAMSNSTIIAAGSLGVVTGGVLSGGTLTVAGGSGGTGVGTSGGPGGSMVNTKVEALDSDGAIAFFLVSGGTGGSSTTGHGGAGGGVIGSTILINEDIGVDTSSGRKGQADVIGGDGGDGATAGGNGGAFSGNDVQFLGLVDVQTGNTLNITGGKGGNVTAAGVGGHGGNFQAVPVNGKLHKNSILLNEVADSVLIHAGNGGSESTPTSPGSGGAGGSLNGLTFEVLGDGPDFEIQGGRGGNGGTIGNGGAGGLLSSVATTLHGAAGTSGFFLIQGGAGGSAGTTKGTGGGGGNLTNVIAKVNRLGSCFITGGNPGLSRDSNGVPGGNLSGVAFENYGQISTIRIFQGPGGGIIGGNGNAGNSGALSKVTVSNFGGVTSRLEVGLGTAESHRGTGNGSNGGTSSDITINNYAVTPSIVVSSALGTNAGSGGGDGNGGNSGSLRNVTINDYATVGAGSVTVQSKPSITGAGAGKAGNSGSISNVSLFGPHTNFRISTGDCAAALTEGGDAGSISNVHGIVGSLRIDAGDGGAGTGPTGQGGNGGSVTKVNVMAVADFVRWILAGNGGNGTVLGGNGGSISKVQVAGDIGDFTRPCFQISKGVNDGMGGLIAGQAGAGGVATNGSISQVAATRIAAIYAGRPKPNNITAANAVESLTAINAQVIGADVDHNEVFDFIDAGAPGFNLGDGDNSIDGFVLVKHASNLAALPVSPLKGISLVA